jgi:hypothetical protein
MRGERSSMQEDERSRGRITPFEVVDTQSIDLGVLIPRQGHVIDVQAGHPGHICQMGPQLFRFEHP